MKLILSSAENVRKRIFGNWCSFEPRARVPLIARHAHMTVSAKQGFAKISLQAEEARENLKDVRVDKQKKQATTSSVSRLRVLRRKKMKENINFISVDNLHEFHHSRLKISHESFSLSTALSSFSYDVSKRSKGTERCLHFSSFSHNSLVDESCFCR